MTTTHNTCARLQAEYTQNSNPPRPIGTIITRLKRYLFIFIAVYFVLIGGTYYYQVFAVRVFQHIFVTIILSIWIIRRLLHKRGLPPTPLNPVLFLGMVVWFASALVSPDPRMALENLWFPITNLMLFFVMIDLLQTGQERLLIGTQFLLAALIVLLAGFQLGSWFFGWGFATPSIGWASVLGGDILVPLTLPRLFVPLGVSTWLAAYTAPAAIVAGVWGLSVQRGMRHALWFLAVSLVLVMLLTESRGGWISLGAGAAVFLVLQLLSNPSLQKIVRRYATPLLIAAVVIVAASALVLIRVSADPGHSSGDVLRFNLWQGALEIAHDHPVLGVGPGLFAEVYRLYRDPTYVDDRLGTAHNFYLNSLAENGIVGGVIALILGIILLQTWWKLRRSADTEVRRLQLDGALAALVGFAAQSFFDTFTTTPLVLLALGLTAYCVTRPRSRLDPPLKGNIPAAIASLIIVLAFGLGLIRSDQAQAAFIAGVSGDMAQAQQAVALDPALHLYTLEVAYSTALTEDTAGAIAAYQQALALEPTWDTGWINLAALLQRQGNTVSALDALQKAIAINNRNDALFLWARLAEENNAAPANMIVDAYFRYIDSQLEGHLPLSSFWSQTKLRKQAVAAYVNVAAPDLAYRVVAVLDPTNLTKLVPTHPVSAQGWWIVGEYALTIEEDDAKADSAFSKAIRLNSDIYLGDYYASRARARISRNPQAAARDLNIAVLLGTYNKSPNAIRAQMATSPDEQRRLWAVAVAPRIIDQNFEGALFAGRVASFDLLPEMRLPGPGHSILKPWYDLAASYLADGQIQQATNVYHAIVDQAPEENEAQDQLSLLARSASS